MNVDDVIKIIDIIPNYLKLIYPGYITIYLYYFFRAVTIKDTKAIILKAIVLSYIYNIVINEITMHFFISGNLGYNFVENCLLIIMSITIAYIAYRIVIGKKILVILDKAKINTTFSTNEIEEIESQSSNGTWLVVYLHNDKLVYEGYLINKEMEPDKNRYLVLSMYRKFIVNDDGKPIIPFIEDCSSNCNEKVIIYYNQISRIEIRDTTICEE